jgi:hypothetical protein
MLDALDVEADRVLCTGGFFGGWGGGGTAPEDWAGLRNWREQNGAKAAVSLRRVALPLRTPSPYSVPLGTILLFVFAPCERLARLARLAHG